jgi:hypothetical protein
MITLSLCVDLKVRGESRQTYRQTMMQGWGCGKNLNIKHVSKNLILCLFAKTFLEFEFQMTIWLPCLKNVLKMQNSGNAKQRKLMEKKKLNAHTHTCSHTFTLRFIPVTQVTVR